MCYPGVLLDLLWRPRAVEESSLVRWEVRVLEQGVLSQSLYIYSDIALFAIFENWHIAADKGYFYMINTEKSSSLITPKNHRDPKYYLWNVLFIIFWGPCAKLRSNISKWNFGIGDLEQFGTTCWVPVFSSSQNSLHRTVYINILASPGFVGDQRLLY